LNSIPPVVIHIFLGSPYEEPNVFMFEFDILYKMYDYIVDAHKLKLFPSILKSHALRSFIGLGKQGIATWDTMKTEFLSKYQDYCRGKETKVEVLRMNKKGEILEDYLEKFQFNLQCSNHSIMLEYTLKLIFIKGILEEYLDALNLISSGDIFSLALMILKHCIKTIQES